MERSLKCTVFYDTGLTEYEFNFDYIRKRFVCVKYVASTEGDDIDEGQQLVYGNDYTVMDKRVVLRQASTDKPLICIYRQTPTDNIVDFEDSSIIKAKDLDTYDTQNLHLNEELSDYLILHKVSSGTINNIYNALENAQEAANSANNSADIALNAANDAKSINVRTFPNVETMKQANNLKIDMLIKTQGYYSANDGGGAEYIVVNDIGDEQPDDGSIIQLQKNLYAKLLISDYVNVKQFGAYGDGEHDDTNAIQKVFSLNRVILNFDDNKTYKINKQLNIEEKTGLYIRGNNSHLLLSADNSIQRHVINIINSNNITIESLAVERDITVIDKGELGWDKEKGRGAGHGITIFESTNIEIKFCDFMYFDDGIHAGENSRQIIIKGNTLHEIGGEPIVIDGCLDVLVENNEAYHHNGDGILIHNMAYTDDLIDGEETYAVIIRGNFIHDGILPIYNNAIASDQPSLRGGGITTNAEGNTSKLQNGILIEGNTCLKTHYGCYVLACGNIRIINNYFDCIFNSGIGVVQSSSTTGNNSLKLKPCIVSNNIICNGKGLGAGIIIDVDTDDDGNTLNVICTGNLLYNFTAEKPVSIKNTIFSNNAITYINYEGSTQPAIQAKNCIINNLKITDYRGTYIKATDSKLNNIDIKIDRLSAYASSSMPLEIDKCKVIGLTIYQGMGQINCKNDNILNNIFIYNPNTSTNGTVFYIEKGRNLINNLQINKPVNGTFTNKNDIVQLASNTVLIMSNIFLSVANIYIKNIINCHDDTASFILDNIYTFGDVVLPTAGTNRIVGTRIQSN